VALAASATPNRASIAQVIDDIQAAGVQHWYTKHLVERWRFIRQQLPQLGRLVVEWLEVKRANN